MISKTEEQLRFKQLLKEHCLALLNERIANIQNAMKEAQEAANSEEKSSAGDKYETGRAMSQLNKEMYAAQLEEALKELAQMQAADVSTIRTQAGIGAFVVTDNTTLFIAAAMGAIKLQGSTVMVLSPKAPIAIALNGKQKNDAVQFNGKLITVKEVY
ncbi:MAG: hypothetical protein U0V74_08350 [Chitinophagales bacterium]